MVLVIAMFVCIPPSIFIFRIVAPFYGYDVHEQTKSDDSSREVDHL